MTKKKSKKKHNKKAKDKETKDQKNQTRLDSAGQGIKTAGMVMASVLLGQIIEAAIERLLQKFPAHAPLPATAENGSNGQELPHTIAHPVEQPGMTLASGMGASPLGVQDVIEAVRDAVRDVAPTLDDVVDTLKVGTWRSVQQAVGTAGNTTMTAVEGAVSGAKTLIDKLHPTEPVASKKLGKKKRKDKKK
ncbi:hypothetical protein [Leptolyngbya sp. FACHB-17]|uniref:hypothetical protein n=1 Tax=unclassified Leptolyngbya TaxID=2650499 RepID=UPI001681A843|nr:hypothetical protein [Leptolyngbya sp. FACHB-17]MBD2081779.1 hypothetical protein [Leptolyngbya sp. FACHB-17]